MPYIVMFSVLIFVFGTIIGSFLNVVILRTPKKEQIVSGRSHCMSCGHDLAWFDLFPVFSWVFLRGKCRYCHSSVSARYALVETICGLSFLAAFLTLGLTVELGLALILFPVLIVLSFYDIDTGEIEYWCPITIAVLGLIATALSALGIIEAGSIIEHLLGAVIIAVPFALLAFFGTMGGADVQLMAGAGLLLGWKVIPAALIGIVLGAIIGVIIKLRTKSNDLELAESEVLTEEFGDLINAENLGAECEIPSIGLNAINASPASEIPPTSEISEDDMPKGTLIRFGPFLAIGIAVAYLFGGKIIEWYTSLM